MLPKFLWCDGGDGGNLKEARAPMMIALVSYWVIGLPVAYGLAFPAGWGGVGIWWGLATGLAASAILMTLRLLRKIRQSAR